MFCKYCGTQTSDGSDVCPNCKSKFNNEPVEVEAVKVEENTNSNQNTNTNANSTQTTYTDNTNTGSNNSTSSNPEQKSRLAAGLLGIFLGLFGVHNFYLGFNGKAIAQLLITILSCFVLSPVSAIWGFIEAIMILTGSTKTDASGNPLKDDA